MKVTALLCCCMCITTSLHSQDLTSKIIEGAKTLTDVVKIIKPATAVANEVPSTDVSFKNKSATAIEVQLFRKKNDTTYVITPMKLTVANDGTESFIDVTPGIYKYKIVKKVASNSTVEVLKEGEFRVGMNEKKMILVEK